MIELPPLYPITCANRKLSLSEQVSRFSEAGYPLVQFRGKHLPVSEQWRELRKALIESAQNGGWPMIVVNDRSDLAVIAASESLAPWGLHLGQTDLPASVANRLPGLENVHLGASTHNPTEWHSIDKTCDHAGVGPVRATATKHLHDQIIGFDGLHRGCTALRSQNIAPVAIGGLSISDTQACFQAGAVSIAMAQALSPDSMSNDEKKIPQQDIFTLATTTEHLWQAQKQKYATNPILKLGRGVAIVGGSGAGKTTLAKNLAQRMGLVAIDLDELIIKKTGKSIPEIFDSGEANFRNIEAECLPECLEYPAVLALGAGAWHQESIRQIVDKADWSVLWLAEKPKTAWDRVRQDIKRPLTSDRIAFMQRWRLRMAEWSLLPSLLPLGRTPVELLEILMP